MIRRPAVHLVEGYMSDAIDPTLLSGNLQGLGQSRLLRAQYDQLAGTVSVWLN